MRYVLQIFMVLVSLVPGVLRAQEVTPPFILTIHVSGGWDTTMVFDPHLQETLIDTESGAEVTSIGESPQFVHHPDRPSVFSFFQQFGQNACIVNGIYTKSIDYDEALKHVFSAIPDGQNMAVDWFTFYTTFTNPVIDMPSVTLNGPYIPGEYSGYSLLLNDDLRLEYNSPIPNADSLTGTGEDALTNWRASRFTALQEKIHPLSRDSRKLIAMNNSWIREPAMQARVAEIETTLGDPGTDSSLLRRAKFAIEAFAGGYTQTAMVGAGREREWETTEMHFSRQSVLFENLFADLIEIVSYAQIRNIRDNLIILVVSERGRGPKLNSESGKHAWTYTSALLFGAGIQGGQTIGSTDGALRGVPLNPLFGEAGTGQDVTLEMGHIMAALYLQNAVPKSLMLKDHLPLSPILAAPSEEESQ